MIEHDTDAYALARTLYGPESAKGFEVLHLVRRLVELNVPLSLIAYYHERIDLNAAVKN